MDDEKNKRDDAMARQLLRAMNPQSWRAAYQEGVAAVEGGDHL